MRVRAFGFPGRRTRPKAYPQLTSRQWCWTLIPMGLLALGDNLLGIGRQNRGCHIIESKRRFLICLLTSVQYIFVDNLCDVYEAEHGVPNNG